MNKELRAKPINIKLTKEAIRLLDDATKEMGISRTTAIELAVRKAYQKKEDKRSPQE